jgi:hypothetical protein
MFLNIILISFLEWVLFQKQNERLLKTNLGTLRPGKTNQHTPYLKKPDMYGFLMNKQGGIHCVIN